MRLQFFTVHNMWVAAVWLLSFSSTLFAQPNNLKLDRFNTENGLSQNLVYSMAQDNQGFLWFATDEGLNRFDGYEFKKYRHDPIDSTSLSDNSVHSLFFDSKGILWIGTNNGITQYNPKTETFKRMPIDVFDITKFNGNAVNLIREDSKGNIWIAYLGSGIDVVIPGEPVILHYTIHREANDPYRLPDDYIMAFEFLKNGEVILGTRTGLLFIRKDGTLMPDTEALQKYPWKNKITRLVKSIKVVDGGTKICFGTEADGVSVANLVTGQLKTFTTNNKQLLFNNNVPALYQDSKGNIWIGGEAIYLLDLKSERLIPYNEFGARDQIETKNPILSIYEDKANNIWFGTFRLGALKFNPQSAKMAHFHSGLGQGSIPNNQILSFAEDKNKNIFVGTDGNGLFQMKRDQSGFESAALSTKFSSQVIKCIYPQPSGHFWLGTWDGGMMRYHPIQKTLEVFSPQQKNFDSNHVWEIQPDKAGNLWLATLREGLVRFEPLAGQYQHFKNDPHDSTSIANNDVLTVFIDSRNTLWVGTADGLSVRQAGQSGFKNLFKKDRVTNALCFYEDPKGNVWIGSNGGGIIISDKELNLFKLITDQDGLPSATVCAMVPDDHGNVWVSTYNGLVKINTTDYSIIKIPQAIGLQGKEYIPRSGLRTSDGYMLFGGVNGFNMFHPDSLAINPIIPSVTFTSLNIQGDEILPGSLRNEREILQQSISLTNEIVLNHDDNSVTISFSPMAFNWQNNIQFTYILENFDPAWQFTTAEKRFVHYTSLDPGEYKLKVKASFDGKNWPTEAKTLSIKVIPPWWGTIFFRGLAILVVGGLMFVGYKTRVRVLKNRQVRLEQVVNERTQELLNSNREIQKLLEEVASQKNEIQDKNHELMQVNDAVVEQRDDLEAKSIELEKAQNRLKEINVNLETLVGERTQKLSDTLRELETFLYRASHDLRGPISSMLGILNVSELEKDNEQMKKTYSEMFHKSVLQLDRTLQNLLLRHTLERKKIVNESFNKPDLEIFIWEINRSIPSFRVDDFEVIIDSKVALAIDRLVLKTILASLLENAFYYSAKSSDKLVTLEIKSGTDLHTIIVSDRGAGIRPDQQEKIFEMFYRGNELSTGNGLGLYMVKSALEKINGKIAFESEPGKFTIFRVEIPR